MHGSSSADANVNEENTDTHGGGSFASAATDQIPTGEFPQTPRPAHRVSVLPPPTLLASPCFSYLTPLH